ncbi:DNA-directed RNA polymerase II subunit rpb1 [Ceratobasidium sp. 395]|nr:DNA-directed RNA polymerase II subunit rpb1 [Ceratobasidium sp. 395]
MSSAPFAYSSIPLQKIKEAQFDILSLEETCIRYAKSIELPGVLEEGTGRVKVGGLTDPRFGTVDRNFKRRTCSGGMAPRYLGCFGHIELVRPAFHIGTAILAAYALLFQRFLNIFPGLLKAKILECVCVNCGRLKTDTTDTQFAEKIRHVRDPKKRMALVWAHCKGKMICEADKAKGEEGAGAAPAKVGHGGCGHIQPLIRKEGLKLFLVYKKGRADDDEPDLALLGLSEEFARPDRMILTVLPVPPPPVQPSISAYGGTVGSEDDLTHKLGDILKALINVQRCEEEGSPAHVISEFEQLLQFHVVTYMDNDIAGIPQALRKSGRLVKAIRARLEGKEGRLRSNLMGKRVDFSARSHCW